MAAVSVALSFVAFSTILTGFPIFATLTGMFYYLHLLLLAPLYSLVSSFLGRDQKREILLLRQLLLILRRQLGRKLCLRPSLPPVPFPGYKEGTVTPRVSLPSSQANFSTLGNAREF